MLGMQKILSAADVPVLTLWGDRSLMCKPPIESAWIILQPKSVACRPQCLLLAVEGEQTNFTVLDVLDFGNRNFGHLGRS
jgi:hypothetical protein